MNTNILKTKLKVISRLMLGFSLLVNINLLAKDSYPKNKPINVVVGFGIGGSADRMTRIMSTYLSSELKTPLKVINKQGASTQLAADYVLSKPADGYTIFASTFSPYLTNSILVGNAKYNISDFDYLNIQWTDFDIIALNKNSKYNTLTEVLEAIRDNPKLIKASVVQGSSGHLMLRLLLERFNIPQENLNLVTYNSGGQARIAVAGGQVDLISVSAEGSETIKELIKPIAIVKENRVNEWDAPTLNEALESTGITMPIIGGSMRGFAVPKKFKEDYPHRYIKLINSIKATLANKETQKTLQKARIDYAWRGPEESNKIIIESFEIFKSYSYLIKL